MPDKQKTITDVAEEDISFDTYNDYCSDCASHDKCHKYGIDYEKVAECVRDTKEALKRQEKFWKI